MSPVVSFAGAAGLALACGLGLGVGAADLAGAAAGDLEIVSFPEEPTATEGLSGAGPLGDPCLPGTGVLILAELPIFDCTLGAVVTCCA